MVDQKIGLGSEDKHTLGLLDPADHTHTYSFLEPEWLLLRCLTNSLSEVVGGSCSGKDVEYLLYTWDLPAINLVVVLKRGLLLVP